MVLCPNCNTENPDGAKFCRSCGTKLEAVEAVETTPVVEEIEATPAAEEVVEAEPVVEEVAAAPVVEATAEPAEDAVPGEALEPSPSFTLPGIPQEPEPKKSNSAKWVLIAIIAILIAAIALLAPRLFKGSSSGKLPNYGAYIKEQELWYTDLSKKAPSQITTRLFNGEEVDGGEIEYVCEDGLDSFVVVSRDGRTIFYPDKIDFDSDGLTMYFRPLSGKDTEAVKIDSGITDYALNEDCTVFTYLKNSTLYQYSLKTRDKQKIASDIYTFQISGDGKIAVYMTDDDTLYYHEIGKDREKLGTDVDYLENVSEDFSTVWFSAKDNLYKKEAGKDVEKVLTGVPSSGIEKVYDTGEVFYFITSKDEKMLIDYVNDDLKDIDDKITEPVEPEYPEEPEFPERPYPEDFATQEEYEAAVEKYLDEYEAIEDAYYAAVDKFFEDYDKYEDLYYDYLDKLDRDDLREDLAQTFAPVTYEYYYFDGENSTLLCDNYDNWSAEYATDKAAALFTGFDYSDFGKIDISDVYSVYDVDDMLRDAMYDAEGSGYLACGATVSEIPGGDPYYMHIAPDASFVYYFDAEGFDLDTADLYKLPIENGKVLSPALYAEDAYVYRTLLYEGGEIIHYRNVDSASGSGDLYLGDTFIDSDVDFYRASFDSESKSILYVSDYDYDREYGTLYVYRDGKKEKVHDDVHNYCVTFGGDIMYLCDYSVKHHEGDLYVYRKGSSTKIDTEVTAIVPPYRGTSAFLY